MTETKFTPGPWDYDPEINRVFSVPTNKMVATVALAGNPACEAAWPTDAHLIAAAPELYETVAGCLGQIEAIIWHNATTDWSMWRDDLRAALAKARGEAQ